MVQLKLKRREILFRVYVTVPIMSINGCVCNGVIKISSLVQ